MQAAAEYDLIPLANGAALACWHAYDSASKVELHSTALRIGQTLIFVDPIPLEEDALLDLLAGVVPAGIILTNANHTRASAAYRKRFGIAVHASEEITRAAPGDPNLKADGPIPAAGGKVLDFIEAIPLPGAAPGEMALYFEGSGDDSDSVMMLGDALIDLPGYGFSFLPPKYCSDPRLLRTSVRGLLARSFDKLTLAHGEPIAAHAHARLASLLGSAEGAL